MTISRYSIRLAAGSILLLFLAAGGCSRTVNRTAERRIRDVLPSVLGPAKSYRVHIDNPPGSTLKGRLASVAVDGDDVQLPNGFLVDNLHLVLKNVDVDTARGTVRSIGDAHFVMTAGEASLDEFLAGEEPEAESIRAIHVTFGEGDSVTIAGERVVLGAGIPFRISGTLRITSPTKVRLDPDRLTVLGLPITGKLLRFITRKFESSIDLTALGIPATLEHVSTGGRQLKLEGSLHLEGLLERAQPTQNSQ